MADRVLQGHPDIALTLRRSARARRITLRISSLDGRVTLTMPNHVAEQEALDFARQKERWIRKHLATRVEDVVVGAGTPLPIEGQLRMIVQGKGRRVVMTEDELLVPGGSEAAAARTLGFLKARARDVLAAACDDYARRLGRPYHGLTLRDTRSRWGSCSSAGRLMFSWRLILAPPEVLQYVAAHEVAHLEQMNHSPAFWNAVTRIHGPYDTQRRWLRTEGNALHRFRFGD
ncbi:zinc metalloprotease [Tateyamaria omphalii]|uniref:M48 family metallopeptidase n=1 Tax=Tateyamaria omphalii TaxID=299262 RepID=UPI001673F997|nr:SprT family zinc-dependent metalloprotease [Tateyamaria omphalii]GGX43267.1 zinc metalloprotease [Tateyamaria omphalii]